MTTATERPSLRAPAMPAKRTAKASAPKNRAERRAASKLEAAVARQLERFTAAPSPDARARFDATVSAGRACEIGAECDASAVLREYLRVLALCEAHIAQSRLAPYGPMRTRYALNIAAAVASLVTAEPAVAPAQNTVAQPVLTTAERRRAKRTLASFTSTPEAKSAITAALAGNVATTARELNHETLAARVAWVRANVSSDVRVDAGLTDVVLSALEAEAHEVLDQKSAKRDEASARRAMRTSLAERCGRLVVELRHLVAAARDHRRDDASVPAVSSRFANPERAKKSSAEKPAEKKSDPLTPPQG